MRANEFIRIGLPILICKRTAFHGINTGQNMTIREFNAKLTVDGNSYTITIHVVSDELSKHELLLGKDFLDTVKLNIKCGTTTITPVRTMMLSRKYIRSL